MPNLSEELECLTPEMGLTHLTCQAPKGVFRE
jgi:hypothetical protein